MDRFALSHAGKRDMQVAGVAAKVDRQFGQIGRVVKAFRGMTVEATKGVARRITSADKAARQATHGLQVPPVRPGCEQCSTGRNKGRAAVEGFVGLGPRLCSSTRAS